MSLADENDNSIFVLYILGEPPTDEHFVDTPGKSASTNLFLYQVCIKDIKIIWKTIGQFKLFGRNYEYWGNWLIMFKYIYLIFNIFVKCRYEFNLINTAHYIGYL